MLKKIIVILVLLIPFSSHLSAQNNEGVFPGADEKTPSKAQYFSWINNTNEGPTEAQTLINLEFFRWLLDEYGMRLDIYAFDAGAIDGKRFYGNVDSDRFRIQFPNGFEPIYDAAKKMGTRLGVWGGPDGFGNTPEEESARTEQMVNLCRDLDFALFKFDAVCGPLRPEKEDAFIRMMTLCRKYSPDLILLNHRLGFKEAQAHATTFLWQGKETYIDVWSTNNVTAPHHRADAISRGLVPDLQRLTEDHGVCLSSCLDYWEDDLVLQAFNRSLILAPQLYGNPWLLRDDEYPKLARIFNLHRKYRDILVHGLVLPEDIFGPFAVSRGDEKTRLITLRNLSWESKSYKIPLDQTVGLLGTSREIHCRQFFPTESIFGDFPHGTTVEIEVAPFRSCLLLVTAQGCDEPGVVGSDYEVIRNIEGKSIVLQLKGLPGTEANVSLPHSSGVFKKALLNGQINNDFLNGESIKVRFPGETLQKDYHRKLSEMKICDVPVDAQALYEATVFAADNNALEVRSLFRSGESRISQVTEARNAFFSQSVFLERGIWDKNLFDGDTQTGFWPTKKYSIDMRVENGCFRLDFGEIIDIDRLVLHVPDEYSLQPILRDEGNYAEVSTDLKTWERLTYLAGKRMVLDIPDPVRYIRFRSFPDRITEIEGFKENLSLSRTLWRASNLFAHPARRRAVKAWSAQCSLDEWVEGSYLCIALEGEHGREGAYAAIKVNGLLIGCPDRAPSFPSNTWEYVNARRDKNYTYYVPITKEMIGQSIEIFVLAYNEEKIDLTPTVWQTAYPAPYEKIELELTRKK